MRHFRMHANFRPFICGRCGLAFKTQAELDEHVRKRADHHESRGLASNDAVANASTLKQGTAIGEKRAIFVKVIPQNTNEEHFRAFLRDHGYAYVACLDRFDLEC